MSAINQIVSSIGNTTAAGTPFFLAVGVVATDTNPVVPLPATHDTGDLLVIVASGNSNYTSPAGWSVGVNNTTNARMCLWYKIDNGGESDVSLTGGGAAATAVMLSYRQVNATPLDVNGVVATASSGSATTTSLTTLTNNSLIISAFNIRSNGVTFTGTPASTNVRFNSGAISTRPLLVVDEILTTAGASTTRTATLVSDTWQTYAISFKP